MGRIMLEYPVYTLRTYTSMEELDGRIYVNTYFNRYILDDRNLEGNFLERRLLMSTMKYEVGLYALKYKCNTLVQINKIFRAKKYSRFIDRSGRITTYVPKKLYQVEWKRCTCYPSADGMFYSAVVKGEPYHFVLSEPYAYLALVTFNGGRHVYDVSNTEPEKEVMWRKL